jgi:hypothetical protein
MMFYVMMNPGVTAHEMQEFRDGAIPKKFGTRAMKNVLVMMTHDDIASRPDAIVVVEKMAAIEEYLQRRI